MTEARLVPLDHLRLPIVREWVLDPELRDLIGTVRPPTDVEHERWFQLIVADPSRMVSLILDEAAEPSGLCALSGIDLVYRKAELWIYVAVGQAKGLGRSAVQQQLSYAFDTLGLHRVFVRVFGFNDPAHRFFKACGFRDEGIERDGVFKRGAFHDVFLMGILTDEHP